MSLTQRMPVSKTQITELATLARKCVAPSKRYNMYAVENSSVQDALNANMIKLPRKDEQ